MNKPYIGVTDFTSRLQVERAKAAIPDNVNRRLHVGAMTSYKVINRISTSKGWDKIWLNERGLNELFTDDPDVYNVIHYADYDHSADQRAPTTVLELVQAVTMSGPFVNAIQLDMVWPEHSLISEFLYIYPDIDVILQVSSKAIAETDTRRLHEAIAHYENVVNYVLIDTGMGRGTTFDPKEVIKFLHQVTWSFDLDRVAVAGGLGPETYENLRPLLQDNPDLSCDAQGRLRPSHNAVDPLNIDYVEQYIKGVCSLLTEID